MIIAVKRNNVKKVIIIIISMLGAKEELLNLTYFVMLNLFYAKLGPHLKFKFSIEDS